MKTLHFDDNMRFYYKMKITKVINWSHRKAIKIDYSEKY